MNRFVLLCSGLYVKSDNRVKPHVVESSINAIIHQRSGTASTFASALRERGGTTTMDTFCSFDGELKSLHGTILNYIRSDR